MGAQRLLEDGLQVRAALGLGVRDGVGYLAGCGGSLELGAQLLEDVRVAQQVVDDGRQRDGRRVGARGDVGARCVERVEGGVGAGGFEAEEFGEEVGGGRGGVVRVGVGGEFGVAGCELLSAEGDLPLDVVLDGLGGGRLAHEAGEAREVGVEGRGEGADVAAVDEGLVDGGDDGGLVGFGRHQAEGAAGLERSRRICMLAMSFPFLF